MKDSARWYSPRVQGYVTMTRWGTFGLPVLVFPTAGGDAEEIERFHLVGSVQHLIDEGRVKLYSVDSVAGRAWINKQQPAQYQCWLQDRFHAFIHDEVVPAIRNDCHSMDIEIAAAGASLGAFNAVSALCRYPSDFRLAIGMSGTYDMQKFTRDYVDDALYFSSPIHFLPNLGDGPQLQALRERFVLMAFAGGRWEDPGETWRMAAALGDKGVPNRVDPWGSEYDHDWPAWRAMLPRYLEEFA